ncbi:MAG: hypothetical protein FWG87_08915 [Defluviitaleaceae bacterium]|nr:hypothetical protein [Defluviitaleaceae bacterium]
MYNGLNDLPKLSIQGDFWDCQIYKGKLYLWTFDGKIITYNWDSFISDCMKNSRADLAMTCAFLKGYYLYNPSFDLFFGNNEIKEIIKNQFKTLSRKKLFFTEKDLEKYILGTQDLFTPELSIDSGVYYNKFYVADETGIYSASANDPRLIKPISTRTHKLWDGHSLSLKIGRGGNIAVSAGSDGLFEYNQQVYNSDRMKLINARHSSSSNWAFSSIYSTSYLDGSFLSPYYYDDDNGGHRPNEIIDDSVIFGDKNGLSWAYNEKFYKYSNDAISIVRFTQKNLKSEENKAFEHIDTIKLQSWKGDVISTGVSHFGTILECDNAMIILPSDTSDNTPITIPGRVVRWRVYPKSIDYINHLHIITETSIDIYSFNNDYLVDQKSKKYGAEYKYYTRNNYRQHYN